MKKVGDKMNFFKRTKKDIKNQENRTWTLSEINQLFENSDILNVIGNSDLTAATYYACMLIRCNAVAKIPFKVKRSDGDGSEDFPDHNLSELLKFRPNQFTNAHDFMWATEFQRLEYGNAFWVYKFAAGKIKELYLLDSTKVQIIIDDTCLLGKANAVYYIYTDNKQGDIIYPSNKIAHFKNFARNGIKGEPIKRYLYNTINQEKYSQQVINSRYKNGLQDPVIVTYTGDLDKAHQIKIQKKFDDLGGIRNAGKVIPIPVDFKVDTLETKLVSNQFFELNGLTARHIANAFGVKSFQLNDMEKSTYANIEQQNRAFYSDTLQNVFTAYEQEIDYKLLSKSDRVSGVFVKANADVMLRSDIEARYKAYREGIEGGFLKISEVRKREDLPFVPDTDRLIIGNGASIPLQDLGKQYDKGGESNE